MGCYKIVLNLSKPTFHTSHSGRKVYVSGKQSGCYKDPVSNKKIVITESASGNGDECEDVVEKLKIELTRELKNLMIEAVLCKYPKSKVICAYDYHCSDKDCNSSDSDSDCSHSSKKKCKSIK